MSHSLKFSIFMLRSVTIRFSGGPKDDLRIPKESIGKYLFDCLKRRNPIDIVNIDADTKEVLTCERLLKESIKLSVVFKQLGLEKGDIIAVVSENTINYCVLLLAALNIGIILNPLNPAYAIGELRHALLISKPKLIFCSEQSLSNVLKVKKELSFIKSVIGMGNHSKNRCDVEHMEELLETTTVDVEYFYPDTSFNCSEHGAFILLSSGTTGLPKGVLITHSNFQEPLNYFSHPTYGNVTSKETAVFVPPFFHIFGLIIQLLAVTTSMKLVLIEKFKPKLFLQAVKHYKATKLFLVPPLLLFLAKSPLVDDYDISSVNDIMVAGATVGKELQEKVLERLSFVVLRQIYGLTEVTGACTFQTVNANKSGSVGILVPNITAKIWDVDGKKTMGPLKTGEICFKGPMIMKGYFDNIRATQECIDQDGFYHTGDLGFYDHDEQFYIVGRLKELIKYKGFQVPPAELEALILTHPGVGDCAVIGIPDERAGQLPLAYVVRQNGMNVTEREILDYVAERISVQKRLHGGAVFIEEIPKNPSGKILRRKLVEIYEASR